MSHTWLHVCCACCGHDSLPMLQAATGRYGAPGTPPTKTTVYLPTASRLLAIAWMSIRRPTGSSSVHSPCTPMLLLLLDQNCTSDRGFKAPTSTVVLTRNHCATAKHAPRSWFPGVTTLDWSMICMDPRLMNAEVDLRTVI
jgi:hypothetical protein